MEQLRNDCKQIDEEETIICGIFFKKIALER